MKKQSRIEKEETKWLEIINPQIRLGEIRFALIDFDGTLSVIRQGWEEVMIPMMIEMICENTKPDPQIIKEVQEYVDYSTGILTIKQMRWLENSVKQYGIAKSQKTAHEYKIIYNRRLLERIDIRIKNLRKGIIAVDDMMMIGSREFLKGLQRRGVIMYLVSGTDHKNVQNEANLLGVTDFFQGGIYGALDHTEANTKERIIQKLLDEKGLDGKQLLVVGDGPVEIRNAKSVEAIALGVASNEIAREGLNALKRDRLVKSRADLIISDFKENKRLLSLLFDEIRINDIDAETNNIQ